jgi:hypothetical protein
MSHGGRIGRRFGPDDLIALEVLSKLLRIGVISHIAFSNACDFRASLHSGPASGHGRRSGWDV